MKSREDSSAFDHVGTQLEDIAHGHPSLDNNLSDPFKLDPRLPSLSNHKKSFL